LSFNFTRDVVDRARGRGILFVDRDGRTRELSFAEVSGRAAQWTNLLRRRGIEPGDRVLVLLDKTPEWSAAMCGCRKAGAIAVPCSELLRAKDLDFRVRHSGASLLIAAPFARGELDRMDADVAVLTVDEARLDDEPDRAEAADTAASDNALILCTSGTTKDPRGVAHARLHTGEALASRGLARLAAR
jgi:acyl-coenzyme A synthetase/AMP-(fatty) acid ligase